MRKLWLLFAQSATISLGALFVVALVNPDLLPWRSKVITVNEAVPPVAAMPKIGSYREAVKKAMPAVVNIFTTKEVRSQAGPLLDDPLLRRFFGDRGNRTEQQSSLGSGVIVGAQGYILTNHHVVEAADEIQVALADGRAVAARIVGVDPESDLAVLKIDLDRLPAITFGASEQINIGDVVLAIGNPFGVGQTVTMGIVSALGRTHLGINTFENFIQTDAAINPGNSGGALIDVSGNLIGINSAIYSRTGGSQGIGFTIPVSLAKHVMEDIIRTGSVTRGWIGVEVQDVTPELADSFKMGRDSGALIAGVLRGGPADLAGMKPGDVLVEVNGKHVRDSYTMLTLISDLEPGRKADLKLLRNRKELKLPVPVGRRPRTEQVAQ
jgi:serine protease DegQ